MKFVPKWMQGKFPYYFRWHRFSCSSLVSANWSVASAESEWSGVRRRMDSTITSTGLVATRLAGGSFFRGWAVEPAKPVILSGVWGRLGEEGDLGKGGMASGFGVDRQSCDASYQLY